MRPISRSWQHSLDSKASPNVSHVKGCLVHFSLMRSRWKRVSSGRLENVLQKATITPYPVHSTMPWMSWETRETRERQDYWLASGEQTCQIRAQRCCWHLVPEVSLGSYDSRRMLIRVPVVVVYFALSAHVWVLHQWVSLYRREDTNLGRHNLPLLLEPRGQFHRRIMFMLIHNNVSWYNVQAWQSAV